MLNRITPLILTHNEAANIGRSLAQLQWANEIVVVDSFSDDETVEIVSTYGNVRVIQRDFDSHENQWNFGLTETNITTPWVLTLDADHILTADFVKELESLSPDDEITGYKARFVYCIGGRKVRSGIYPPLIVLHRHDAGRYRQDGHTQRLILEGKVGFLAAPILHDDRKPLNRWLKAQARYTQLEAEKLIRSDPGSLSWTNRIRRWRFVAPVAVFFYCMIARGGLLDGRSGIYYAFQRMLAELMLSLYLIDYDLSLSLRGRGRKRQRATTSHTPNSQSEIGDS